MKIATLCKYVDQPMVLNKLDHKMPVILIGAGGGYGIYDSLRHSKKDKKQFEKKEEYDLEM